MNTMRNGLFLVLAVLAAGCDSANTKDGRCVPAEGCDGIAEIAEIAEVIQATEITDFAAAHPVTADCHLDGCEQGEHISYVAESMRECADISILCLPDWLYFSNECGCGCRYVGRPMDYKAP